jgi:phosphate transport system protein
MTRTLHQQIERLKQMLLDVGALVGQSVDTAIQAAEKGDVDAARWVIDHDRRIDQAELDVEEESVELLALFQPLALDLRYVVAVLKINSDLERIADLACNISERAIALSDAPALPEPLFDLVAMSDRTRRMFYQSLDCLVKIEPDIAEQICRMDDEIDRMHQQTFERICDLLREHPKHLPQYLQMLGISRQLERIADHAVNIAEDVLFMSRGEITRHLASGQDT